MPAKRKRVQGKPNVAVLFAKGTAEGARKAAEHVLKESNKHVPLEDRDLMESGRVTQDGNTAAVSYHSPYAVKQHEHMGMEHDTGRTSKFLENAFNSEKKAILEILAREIREEL